MNICRDCKHSINAGGMNSHIWYNWTCAAVTRDKAVDPVNGMEGFEEVNSPGGRYFTEEKHPYCRAVNTDGECMFFEVKK